MDATAQTPSLWASIREAITGSHKDFTTGSIRRAIFLLALPMILEMAMESLFGIVDVYFVAHLGSDAVATVGLVESQLTVVFGVGLGLGMATAAVVARRTGEKDSENAARAAFQGLLLTIAVAALLATTGVLLGPTLLQLMGASSAIRSTGGLYSRIVLGSSGIILFLFVINAIFRGAGDAAASMRVLWLANAINIVLDPCLIRGLGPFPRLGVTGAAVATLIGRSAGVFYQFHLLFRSGNRLRIEPRHFGIDREVILRIARMALSGMGQYLIAMASWIGVMRIMSTFGSAALAGYTIAIRIVIFSILPSWGMGNAAATLVGQNLGAGYPERAEKSVWKAAKYNSIFLGAISIIFMLFAGTLIRIFTQDESVISIGSSTLRILCTDYVLFAYGMVIVQSFNGAGDTTTPTIINLFIYWLLQLPLAYTLAITLGWGPKGTAAAIAIADACLAITSILIFRRGAWKLRKV